MKGLWTISVVAGILILGTFAPSLVQAENEFTEITVEFLNGKVIDLDEGAQIIRADVSIKNYNPQDGFYFMKITRLLDGEVKESEIVLQYVDDYHWKTQVSHYIDPSEMDEYLIGDYQLEVYSQYGYATATERFSIIKSSIPQLNTQYANEILGIIVQETPEGIEVVEMTESRIPTWVHNIFVWYAELSITEDDLLQAIEYLINEGIIQVNRDI